MNQAVEPLQVLPVPPSLLGESPLWHPASQVLYWCDIPGHCLHRWDPRAPADAAHASWDFETDVACCVPVADGSLVLGLRSGLEHFDPATGARRLLAAAPYDTAHERFNDGKVDRQGRFWVGTIYEPRNPPLAALYRFTPQQGLQRMADDLTVSNGLAFSLDGATMHWADTKRHTVWRLPLDCATGRIGERRAWLEFPPRGADEPLSRYGGRPDGATVDAEGAYWVAMFEGQQVLRFSPAGEVLQTVALPTRCPTMVCLGGEDLRTLYITTARHNRPAEELAAQPLAGGVLSLRVPVPGVPADCVAL